MAQESNFPDVWAVVMLDISYERLVRDLLEDST